MGSEFGQGDEWNESHSVDWHLLQYPFQSGLQRFVADLQHVYRSEPALHQVEFDRPGFEWLEARDNENSVFAFLRHAADANDCVLVVSNFTPVPRESYRIGVPFGGVWQEILNSDSRFYEGSDMG